MSFDGTVVRAVVRELSQQLQGGRISKIYQPTQFELLLIIRARGKNHKLLLSAHPAYSRLHLTSWNPEQPKEPPTFCMHVRKQIEGGIIREIQQVDMERIIILDIQSRNELGDQISRKLIVETMGRHSNIILVDAGTNKILDAIRRIPPAVSQVRQVLPGLPYQLPPSQEKRDPLTVSKEVFIASLDYNKGKLDRQIMNRYTGIGPVIAWGIVEQAGVGGREKLWEAFASFQKRLKEHQYEPTLVETEEKSLFAIIPLQKPVGKRSTFATVSELLDKIYLGRAERERNRQLTKELSRRLQNEIEKNSKKIAVLKRELQEGEKAETDRLYGELLTTYMHQLTKGDTTAKVVNYYDPEGKEIIIPLDPLKTPAENAQAYYKKYQKAKSRKKWNTEQIQKASEEIEYLETILVQLEQASILELEQIQEELVEEGWLKPKKQTKAKRKKEQPLPSVYYASDGTEILVGKNNKQNDYLTHRLAHANDLWLHTKEIPGSHVVIRKYNGAKKTLHEAATLAAYFSKARQSSQVPVDYTYIKHVKKPSGAKPGFVIYTHQQTIFVTPEEEIVESLLQQKKRERKD